MPGSPQAPGRPCRLYPENDFLCKAWRLCGVHGREQGIWELRIVCGRNGLPGAVPPWGSGKEMADGACLAGEGLLCGSQGCPYPGEAGACGCGCADEWQGGIHDLQACRLWGSQERFPPGQPVDFLYGTGGRECPNPPAYDPWHVPQRSPGILPEEQENRRIFFLQPCRRI